ncbi:MAG: hypothetical protein AAFZ65_03155 [Planctomycetota bacterium]
MQQTIRAALAPAIVFAAPVFAAFVFGSESACAQSSGSVAPLPDVAYERPITGTVSGYVSGVWDHYFEFLIDGRELTRYSFERDAVTDDWQQQKQGYSTAYRISAIGTCDGGHTLYVAGFSDAGAGLIERWTFPKREGGWSVVVPSLAPAAGGVTTPALVRGVVGAGPWVSPVSQPGRLVPTREALFHSPGRYITNVTVDQNQRYLVFYDAAAGELVQLDLTGPQTPGVVLLSAASVAPLLERVTLVELRDFVPEAPNGRKLFLQSELSLEDGVVEFVRTIVSDPENDGTFDLGTPPVFVVGDFSWSQSTYSSTTDWDRFIFHP